MTYSYVETALMIPCEKCSVGAGIPCCTSTGRRATWPHSIRANAANAIWLLGYEDGIVEALLDPDHARRWVSPERLL